MKLLILFVALNILNVIIQTAKSIATIKCGKLTASIVNAVAYGLYTIVIVYTMCDLPLYLKAIIVAVCNLIGVYTVKLIEEKKQKQKLWRIETTVEKTKQENVLVVLENLNISYSIVPIEQERILLLIYCKTKTESTAIMELLKRFYLKYFINVSN